MDIWIVTKSEFNDSHAYLYDRKPAMDELGEGYNRPPRKPTRQTNNNNKKKQTEK